MSWLVAVEARRWKEVRQVPEAALRGRKAPPSLPLVAHAARKNNGVSACGVAVNLLDFDWDCLEVNQCSACMERGAESAENG